MYWIQLNLGVDPGRWGYRSIEQDRRDDNAHLLYRDPKSMLFEAIFHGNSSRVKQLIGSGIDKNSVLHSPVRWEGATVLGTAAYEGHIDIVQYLVEEGTSVNFRDPCVGRSALHWACTGNQYQIACFLINNGAEVNLADKDNVTPIIRAAIGKNIDLVKLLIEKGANVNHVDRLRCSILHYATVHGNKEMIKTAVTGGCVLSNEAIIGKGTPMSNLLHRRDLESCLLLLDAGYDASREFMLMTRQDESDDSDPIIQEVKDKARTINLKQICRSQIRDHLHGTHVQQKISKLQIPKVLQRYLLLEI